VGEEVRCRVRFGEQVSEGKAMLETSEIIFRGDFRLRIPLQDVRSLQAEDGLLSLEFGQGQAILELGPRASKWAQKIRNPRGLLEKLGVKPTMRVSVLGVEDEAFLGQLRERVRDVSGELLPGADLVFYAADHLDDLDRLPELAAAIAPDGGVWVVSPKGKGAVLKDTEVMAAAREAGLVDTKVASFSETHTALRLVIPKNRR
jgi:hypothetical protein